MARLRPLVLKDGTIERLQVGDLLTLGKLNLGLLQPLPILSEACTITSSFHRLVGGAGSTNLSTINGGDEGDLLVLFGPSSGNVKLLDGGNIKPKFDLKNPDEIAIMLYDGSMWYLAASNF